jgi:hypothetical protein
MVTEYMRTELKQNCRRVDAGQRALSHRLRDLLTVRHCAVVTMVGTGASGGTLASVMNVRSVVSCCASPTFPSQIVEQPSAKTKQGAGPFALNPDGKRNPGATDKKLQAVRWEDQDSFFVSKNKHLKTWTMPCELRQCIHFAS